MASRRKDRMKDVYDALLGAAKETVDTPTPEHTPSEDREEHSAPAAQEAQTPIRMRIPAPRQVMRRTQHFLREDQLRRLDELVRRHPGTTRSDFLREAVDMYLEMVERYERGGEA